LKLNNERPDSNLNLKDINNRLSFKIAVSLIADLMKKCDMPYALSVFLPECGHQAELFSKDELVDTIGLQHDEYIKQMGDTTPLLLDIVEQIRNRGAVQPNKSTSASQTEDMGSQGLSLEQKLRNIDHGLMDRVASERAAPFKSLEERMVKYKREMDDKFKQDLDKEIARLREFEVSKIRMEEAMKYRKKMEEFTAEMQEVHLKNVRELKGRENETLNRIKEKERVLEQVAYEHRQKVLKDEEMLRFKEQDLVKTTEMELLVCKQERDKTAELAREYDRKISEMSELRVNLEKDMAEQLANYKT